MKTLLTEEQLRQGIERLADEIRRHYQGRPLTIVGVLIGSIVFLADLIRRLDMPLARRSGAGAELSQRGHEARPAGAQPRLAVHRRSRPRRALGRRHFRHGKHALGVAAAARRPRARERPHRGPAAKDGPMHGSHEAGLRRLRHPQRLRRRLRPGLPRQHRNLPYLAVLEADEIKEDAGR